MNNGRLHRMTYGNGAWVEYTYDLFDRVTRESHSDGTEHYYFYDTEDRLTRQCSVKNGTVTGVYTFVYDSLGRLIRSKQTSDGTLHANTVDEGTTVQQTQHLYDQENRITRQSWTIQGKTYSESYTYNDSTNSSGTLKDGSIRSIEYQPLEKTVTFGYDNLKHLNSIVVPGVYQRLFGYKTLSTNRSSNLVSSMSYHANDGSGLTSVNYYYAYDAAGNITAVLENNATQATYAYDSQGQLITENRGGKTLKYTYDTAGNLLKIEDGTTTTKTLTYGNANWRDQLTAVNGTAIQYDGCGNPTNWYNGSKTLTNLTWAKGRQLTGLTKGSNNVSYTYDMNGIRTSKTTNGVTYNYITQNGQVVRQSWKQHVLDIIYDNNNQPFACLYSSDYGATFTTFYYILNQQGDVTKITDASGNIVGTYIYDAWGTLIGGAHIGTGINIRSINPIRYRGYYYDTESGFYYLQSRYYDPAVGRFINADSASMSELAAVSIADANLYAYCGNNPVSRDDSTGEFWNIAIGAVMGAAISMATQAVDNLISGNKVTDGLLNAAVSGAITGGFAASGAGKIAQAIVSGVVAAGSEYVSQRQSGEKTNIARIVVSGAIGAIGGFFGGDGLRHKNGDFAKAKRLYDYTMTGVKQNRWRGSRASKYLTYAANKLHKTWNTAVWNTTKSYTKWGIRTTVFKHFVNWVIG